MTTFPSLFRRHARPRHGVTLTEGIIVLAIAGIALGAIWAAASAVRQKARVNETTAAIIKTAQAIRELYSQQSHFTLSPSTDITQNLIDANVFPREIIYPTAPLLRTSWGDPITVTVGGINTRFRIVITGMDVDACKNLAGTMAAQSQALGIPVVTVNGTSYNATSAPTIDELDVAMVPNSCTNLSIAFDLKH